MQNARKLDELAELIVEVHRQLDPLADRSKELKEELRTYEGRKATTRCGSIVSISAQTEDRLNGTQIVFNEKAFHGLGPDVRA